MVNVILSYSTHRPVDRPVPVVDPGGQLEDLLPRRRGNVLIPSLLDPLFYNIYVYIHIYGPNEFDINLEAKSQYT